MRKHVQELQSQMFGNDSCWLLRLHSEKMAKLGHRYRELGEVERLGIHREGQEGTERRMLGESWRRDERPFFLRQRFGSFEFVGSVTSSTSGVASVSSIRRT